MLAFRVGDHTCPGRTQAAEWTPVIAEGEWQLLAQPVSETWKGFPATHVATEDWHLWLLGELYGAASPLETTQDALREVAAGRRAVGALSGHFLLCGRHHETRRWHFWTNRLGTLHAYYATDGRRAAVGTFLPAVAAAASRRRLDWTGLTGFFAYGFFPQDRTFFEDLRILRPATHYVFDDEGCLLQQERYWQWWHQPDEQRSYDDTVAQFDQVLNEVLDDYARHERIALPISGGLDSRTTVASLTRGGYLAGGAPRLWAYSYGYSHDSVETRIARQIASARNLPFRAFVIEPYLFDRMDLVSSSVEGFQDFTQSRQAGVVDELGRQADRVVAAHWGDVWLDDVKLVGDDERTPDDEAVFSHALHKIEKKGRDWLLKHLCRPRLQGQEPETVAQNLMRAEMSLVRHLEDAEFRIKAFKTDQWSFRWTTASLRMYQPAAFPLLPFYDTRMMDFFCTVPSSYVRGRRLQIDHLKRYAPDLARITWQFHDTNLFLYRYYHTWLLPKRAYKKAIRALTRKRPIEQNWEVQLMNDEGRRRLEQWLLRPGLRLHEFVAPDAIRLLLDAFYAPPLNRGQAYAVSMLLTFSVWLERYG